MEMRHILSPFIARWNCLKQWTFPGISHINQFFQFLFLFTLALLLEIYENVKNINIFWVEELFNKN
jgi:hypothetical protein